MSVIDELTEYFRKFPGVGPRQAHRFVYYLLRVSPKNSDRIAKLILDLRNETFQCESCNRIFLNANGAPQKECEICRNAERIQTQLLVVENDTDFEAIEHSRVYDGLYFIIGSLVKILDDKFREKINLEKLTNYLNTHANVNEVIFALDATPDGENTIEILKKEISEKISRQIKLSVLGRGLSTGTEIEYTDTETLKNALNNRF